LLLYAAFCASVPARRDVGFMSRLHAWLVISRFGTVLTTLHAVTSLVSCVLFIVEGYLVPGGAGQLRVPGGYRSDLPLEYQLAEQALQPVLVCHYFLLLYVAGQQRCYYVISLMSIIDLVTVIPVYIDLYELMVHQPTPPVARRGLAACSARRLGRAARSRGAHTLSRLMS
jgi:hypothetical protein